VSGGGRIFRPSYPQVSSWVRNIFRPTRTGGGRIFRPSIDSLEEGLWSPSKITQRGLMHPELEAANVLTTMTDLLSETEQPPLLELAQPRLDRARTGDAPTSQSLLIGFPSPLAIDMVAQM